MSQDRHWRGGELDIFDMRERSLSEDWSTIGGRLGASWGVSVCVLGEGGRVALVGV